MVQVVNRDDDGCYAERKFRCGAEFPDDHETRMRTQCVENLEFVPPVFCLGLYHGLEGRRYADAHIVLTGNDVAAAAVFDGYVLTFFDISGVADGKAGEEEYNCQDDAEHTLI